MRYTLHAAALGATRRATRLAAFDVDVERFFEVAHAGAGLRAGGGGPVVVVGGVERSSVGGEAAFGEDAGGATRGETGDVDVGVVGVDVGAGAAGW